MSQAHNYLILHSKRKRVRKPTRGKRHNRISSSDEDDLEQDPKRRQRATIRTYQPRPLEAVVWQDIDLNNEIESEGQYSDHTVHALASLAGAGESLMRGFSDGDDVDDGGQAGRIQVAQQQEEDVEYEVTEDEDESEAEGNANPAPNSAQDGGGGNVPPWEKFTAVGFSRTPDCIELWENMWETARHHHRMSRKGIETCYNMTILNMPLLVEEYRKGHHFPCYKTITRRVEKSCPAISIRTEHEDITNGRRTVLTNLVSCLMYISVISE